MSDNRYTTDITEDRFRNMLWLDRTKRVNLSIPLDDEAFGSVDQRIDLLEFADTLDVELESRDAGEVVDSGSGAGWRTMLIEGARVPSILAAIRRAAKRIPLPAGSRIEVWNPRTESWDERRVPGVTSESG